jgi:hypothetical protein
MKLDIIVEGIQDLATRLNELRPAMAAAAQSIYDAWNPEYDEFGDAEVGGGGICDQIAQAIGEILTDANIDYTEGGHEGDDHAYLITYDDQNSYLVDIPYNHYESGGGMSWTRHPDVTFTPEMIEIYETHRPDWINESYEGLEDADEFETPNACYWCGTNVEQDDQYCRSCKEYLDSEEFNGRERQQWISSANKRNVNESYEGLEDADEFRGPGECDEGCDDCGAIDARPCETCDGCYCPEHIANHERREIIASRMSTSSQFVTPSGEVFDLRVGGRLRSMPADVHNDMFTLFRLVPCEGGAPLAESYDGLEDADEFAESEHDFCDGCINDFHWEDLDSCNSCDSVWCDHCVSKGSMFDWVPEQLEDGSDTHPDAGMMIACPRCMSDDYVSPFPDDQYGQGTFEAEGMRPFGRPPIPPGYVKESYEGLEDKDSFRFNDDHCMHCGREFNLRNRVVGYECAVHGCNHYTCQDCMTPNGWDYDYATDTGSVATCPECLATYDIE